MRYIRQICCLKVTLMQLLQDFYCKTARYLWVICSGALFSCSGFAATPRYGGTLTTVPGVGLAPPAAMNGFNPLLTSSAYDSEAEGLMYQPLLWINRQFKIDYGLSVARAVVVGPGHRTFTIHLSKGWNWSDGVPVTAADVAYTYHMILKLGPKYPGYASGGIPGEIAALTVVNPYEIRVVTRRPVNPTWFELNGLDQLVPYPAQVWNKYSVNQMYDQMTNLNFFQVVDGPFRLESFHPGRYVSMVANRQFSGPDKPYIHRVIFRFIHSPASVFFALKSGTIQLGNLPAPLYPARHQLRGDRLLTTGPAWSFNYLGFNFDNPHIAFVRDPLVRQAMMHAINQDLFIRILEYGHGVRAFGLVPGVPPAFLSPEAKRLLSQGAYDPALADELLDRAGWRMGPDGIRIKDGHRLAFTLYLPPGAIREPTLLADMLAKVGMEVRMREKPFNEIVAQMSDPSNRHWQAVYLAWSVGAYPTGGSIFKCGGTQNNYHYCSKKMDALSDKIRIHPGLQALYKFQNYFTEQQPVIVLPNMKIFVEAALQLHGLSRAFSPLGSFNPQFIWIGRE